MGVRLLTGVIVVLVTVVASAFGEDRLVLGPRQFAQDTGPGAVLCTWSIYLSLQAQTSACKLERRPIDDAFDKAIADIDEFILTNSSLHPTRAMLMDFKRRAQESDIRNLEKRGLEKACLSKDLEHFRSFSPEKIAESTKKLLSVPREPVMNPCL